MQVPPKSRAALQVNEARLALLLQAVRTSLQMQSSPHSFRLAAVDITAQLARCQVTDLPDSAVSCCNTVGKATSGCFSVNPRAGSDPHQRTACSLARWQPCAALCGSSAGHHCLMDALVVPPPFHEEGGCGGMQAVDLQPEEPATVSQHSAHVSLRERLLRFNVAVLRIVAAACAGLPDSKQASMLSSVYISAP